eukprot:5038234-Amphidinium_carterae.1
MSKTVSTHGFCFYLFENIERTQVDCEAAGLCDYGVESAGLIEDSHLKSFQLPSNSIQGPRNLKRSTPEF